jgi:acyl-coenzyme A synthetase/AMP-(fatty) acid ligase
MKHGLPLLTARDPAHPFAWRAGQAISVNQYLGDVAVLAAQLPERGDVINLCHDRYRFAVGLGAAWSRGRTCLLPPNARADTLAALASATGSPCVLVDTAMDEAVALHVITLNAEGRPALADEVLAPMPMVDPDLAAACLLTSGSTGAPQPHAKRFAALRLNIQAEAQRLAREMALPDLGGVSLVGSVPPQHSYGFESTVLLAMLGGATLDSGRPFFPADMVDALARVPRPRALVTTPFHLKTLLLSGLPLPATELVLSATAPLSPQLARQTEAACQGVLIEIYGCTEAGQVASRRTSAGDLWQTLGELRLQPQPQAEAGLCLVQGGHVTELTPLADLLELQDAQHFHLLGRANDLIHVAGKRSSLAHLNFQLNRVPGVLDGCFWMPDHIVEGVVRPVVLVVAPALSAAALIRALRELIEPAFVPRKVLQVAALPREATGKLSAQALRDFALAQLALASPPGAAHG